MTLLITVFAAVISTVSWYTNPSRRDLKIGTLCWLYWGASIMWLADAIFEYAKLHEAYFTPEPLDMLNDLYLGLSVVALGLVIWVVRLLIQDPRGVVRASLFQK
jgi:hypothetical protein